MSFLGPHWKGKKGYRVVTGVDKYNRKFGGDSWDVPICKLCNEPMHQIFTFDLEDPRLKDINVEGIKEIPISIMLKLFYIMGYSDN